MLTKNCYESFHDYLDIHFFKQQKDHKIWYSHKEIYAVCTQSNNDNFNKNK